MPNEELIGLLNEFANYYAMLGETYREKAYRVAATNLANYLDIPLSSENLSAVVKDKVPGVGRGIYDKIAEYLKRGRIRELELLRKSKIVRAYRILGGVIGVGPQTVKKLINLGVYSLGDLKRAVSAGRFIPSDAQRLGIKYYKDINTRIPHPEATTIALKIRDMLLEVSPRLIIEVAGSYRRGKESVGDLDILVTEAGLDEFRISKLMEQFVAKLHADKNFIAFLAKGPEKTTFLYKGEASGLARQVDIFFLIPENFIPYLIYATGSAEHNEYIRGLCKRRGMRLNQTGLYKVLPNGELDKITLTSERQLYEILEIDYVPPEKR